MAKGILSICWQLLIGIFLILTVLVFSMIAVFDLSAQPRRRAEERAERIAKQYTELEEVDSFAIFNKEKTYYSLQGRNGDGEKLAVLIPQSGGDIRVYPMIDGVTANQAASVALEEGAATSKKETLGFSFGQAVWEIYDGNNYYYIDFESGELLSKEGL